MGMGMFTSTASSMLRSVGNVASHVAGNDDAGAANRVKTQLDMLKEQVVAGVKENEVLSMQVQQLELELKRMREDADMLHAGAGTAALLRQELLHEQQAHKEMAQQLQALQSKLKQVICREGMHRLVAGMLYLHK